MPLSPAALEPLLRLALVRGVGPQRLAFLIRHFGSADRALAASPREVALLPGIGPELARRISAAAGFAGAPPVRRAVQSLQRIGAVALTPDDAAYPDAFRVLSDPPFLVFAAGRLELLERPAVALVGTRAPSDYGRAVAAELALGLANAGYAVVSGMARGIDTAAHEAALRAGGDTIGVLGHGIDRVYPPESRALFARVRERGLLLTEFSPGETPKAGNFPRRNRLIAALSRGVVVVEMGIKSGAQHTVGYALELGREVMAVPGPIGAGTSTGTNQLLREGASVVTSVHDVLEELQGVGAAPTPRCPSREPELPLRSPVEQSILQLLDVGPRHVDELVVQTRLSPAVVLGSLLQMEVEGVVLALPGKQFRRP